MRRMKEALLTEIREEPMTHRHSDPDALLDCCMNSGALDLDILEAHARYAPLCTCHRGRCVCARLPASVPFVSRNGG